MAPDTAAYGSPGARHEIVHQCPPSGSDLMPCCGDTPFAVPPYHRMTVDPKLVTCGKCEADRWVILLVQNTAPSERFVGPFTRAEAEAWAAQAVIENGMIWTRLVIAPLEAAIDPADCQGEGRECYVHPGCVKDGQCVLHRDHDGDCDWGGDERDGD